MNSYIFKSQRLGFRNWCDNDLKPLFEINSNKEVMRYFPAVKTLEETQEFITKMQHQYDQFRFCYFAVDSIESGEFLGFIGINNQTYKADFNPSIDIGWRLHPKYWGKGYASEGAKACLNYAFSTLELKEIVSVAPEINKPSIAVMNKIGMKKVNTFIHPLLRNYPKIASCVLYKINTSF